MSAERKLTLDDMQGMYLLMGAGYLIAVVVLMFEASHRTVAERKNVSFKQRLVNLQFWKHRRLRMAYGIVLSMLERVRHPNEVPDNKEKEYSNFKKYDSRIINSYPIKKSPWPPKEPPVPVYFSEFYLNQLDKPLDPPGTKSLPNIVQNVEMHITPPNCDSYHKISHESLGDQPKDSLKFGSISSLPWDVGNVLHLQENFVDDRAQST